jgi:hypothetical protein
VLTTSNKGTSNKWEVLTKDIGCLIEDTKLERDDAQDSINNNSCYNCVPTPHQDYKELVATRTKAQQNRQR